jgi:hypothetical protein
MTRFSQYLAVLASTNKLTSGIQWLFYPGMLSESTLKWWGDFGTRAAAHEGIDITFYRTLDHQMHHLAAGACVPAWSAGTVINVCEDFLGQSLVVAVAGDPSAPTRMLEVFSHLTPSRGIAPGTPVGPGQVIARLADTRARGSALLPHLHLSCIEVDARIPAHVLNWSFFPVRENLTMINPVFA